MSAWRLLAASLAMAAACVLDGHAAPAAPASAGDSLSVGESIYLRGVLGSGAPLVGNREIAGTGLQGADAACVNCHQHSGLGSHEGTFFIPPVTGDYLFQTHEHTGDDPLVPYVETMHGNRSAYTTATLARAIRDGLDSDGRPLSSLMPHYALDDADLAALTEYLQRLSVHREPGVTPAELEFATIFTPDADPVKRHGVLDVLEHYMVEKNRFPLPPSPRMWTSGKTAYAKSMYMANRHWRLHVWDLKGPASTWRAQLDQHLHDEPVYAVLSGVGGSNWAPVHEFCEQSHIPCLFPNVEVPVEADHDFYDVYFSRGVLLEAGLIAKQILDSAPDKRPHVVEQVYRRGDSGQPASHKLEELLRAGGIEVKSHTLDSQESPRAIRTALAGSSGADVLVLWLRPADVAALGAAPAVRGSIYMSGLMAGLEDAPLPAAWRDRTHMAYPMDLPDKRGVRLDYPLGWFTLRRIPVVALQAQSDTWLACSILTETMKLMADTISREYLIEQMQDMLERRLVTGYYPHLVLAQNERFASKGGYIAHFSGPDGKKLTADSGWLVP